MNPYTAFSEVYDYLLKHVDYECWYKYIRELMLKYVDKPENILELGCGTGRFGAKFSRDNSIIFGMDRSFDMLQVARVRSRKNFRIFCADMTGFHLARQFDFIFSVHDTMNYLLTYSDIRKTLQCVKKVMHKKSIFMFDITTEHNILLNFDRQSTFYNVRDMEVEWSNEYDKRKKKIFSKLEFRKNGRHMGTEMHVQRIYSISEMEKLLIEQGFEVLDVFNDYSFSRVQEDAVMINFISRVKQV